MNEARAFFVAIAAASLAVHVDRILSSPPTPRQARFDDLVEAVRGTHPDADVCEIDRAARPFATGEAGAYVYEADRQRFLPGMEEQC